jgi:predicted RNA-binding Zn ribbon-like protein
MVSSVTSHLVEGRPLPDAVAGDPALELCNTRAIWGSAAPKEYLRDYLTLLLWCRENGVIDGEELAALRVVASNDPTMARRVLGRVVALRDDLYGAVTADSHPQARTCAEGVRRRAAVALRRSRYRETLDGRLEPDGGDGLAMPAHRLALIAHALLVAHGPRAVGRCQGEGCGWVFLDHSHRRHWCVMSVCGNRAKVRRYAARRRAVSGRGG